MLMTNDQPASVGEILFRSSWSRWIDAGVLAKAMGVQRKHVNELCNDRRAVTAPTALDPCRVVR